MKIFLGILFFIALAFAGYYFDLVLCGISEPKLLDIHPCYQNPVGKMAAETARNALASMEISLTEQSQ